MSTTITAHRPQRAWYVVVLVTAVAVAMAIAITLTAYALTRSGGTDRPAPVTTVPRAGHTLAPGNGLPCPIHQPC
jgi:hypothetical protein